MDQIDAKNAREMAVVSLALASLLLDQRAMLGQQNACVAHGKFAGRSYCGTCKGRLGASDA